MSLGLNDPVPFVSYVPQPIHKSAGLAFGLSALIPGAGQLYCGKIGRGAMTLGFWFLALVLSFSHVNRSLVGEAVIVMVVLWIFSFLDAYFTAIEINTGKDDLLEGNNPRVAVMLNLLTAGFGYFYLGERSKGVVIFVVMRVAQFLVPSRGFWSYFADTLLVVVQIAVALDAYRIAHMQVKAILSADDTPLPAGYVPTRLPVHVPIALACLLGSGVMILALIGLAIGQREPARWRAHAAAKIRPPSQPVRAEVSPVPVMEAAPVPAVDLGTAVLNIQQLERKTPLREEDIPNLQRDARVLTSVLASKKTPSSDQISAHYFRGVALASINFVHYRKGEEIDRDSARLSLADFDKVIHGGLSTARTNVPAVSLSNAQYWAGSVARSLLRDEKKAYSYWQECAGEGHAGCMKIMAQARITGEGGVKPDLHEALELHTSVFNTGTRYHCAGASSALSIAAINYFTGVRRPGDDELEWTQKADALLDKLDPMETNRNVCRRGDWEIDEFLLQLGHGHRDDNILQDALSRLDNDSRTSESLIQYMTGVLDADGLDSAIHDEKSAGVRCGAYFDAMWYAKLHGEDEMARKYYKHIVEIGPFHCGVNLVYARTFNL